MVARRLEAAGRCTHCAGFAIGVGILPLAGQQRPPRQAILNTSGGGALTHTMRLSSIGDFALIDRLARQLADTPVSPAAGRVELGIGDDAAVLEVPSGHRVVATADMLVEGIHFRRDWTGPEDLGWKALAVNVSDLGAMGAAPLAALVCLALPDDTEAAGREALYAGLNACAAEYLCPVAGGDTVRSPAGVTLAVTALGTVHPELVATRGGAAPGDLICVTGTLGDSAAGLALLESGRTMGSDPEWAALFAAHLRPEPPVAAARALVGAGLVTAMLDLSDGLASDLRRLAERSGVGVRIEAERLPISLRARQAADALGVDPFAWAVGGGEDYEFLFTVRPVEFARVQPLLGPLGVTATIAGAVREGGLALVLPDGREEPLPQPGFAHFAVGRGSAREGTDDRSCS